LFFLLPSAARELGGLSLGTIQRELDLLSQLGLIDRSTVGKQVFYRANCSHPVFPELSLCLGANVTLLCD
jgi:Fe2+ or Zn2+ uptake regulation protein